MNRELFLVLSMAGVVLLSILVFILLSIKTTKETRLEDIINGESSFTSRNMKRQITHKIHASSLYQKRLVYLQQMLDALYEEKLTPEYIMKYQVICICAGLGTFIIVSFLHILILNIVVLVVTGILFFLYDQNLKSQLKKKLSDFNEMLPFFELQMMLGLDAGASLHKAMTLAISTLDECVTKIEFKRLLLDYETNTEDIATPYMKLSQRVDTKDCHRFCNIVISGIKNGNSMQDILEQDNQYLASELINKKKLKAENAQTSASLISTGLIMVPLLMLVILPLMMSS